MNAVAYDQDTDALLERVREIIERLERTLRETQIEERANEVSEPSTT